MASETVELGGMPERQVIVTYVYQLLKVSEFRDAGAVPELEAKAWWDGGEGQVSKVTHTRKDGQDLYQVTVSEVEGGV